MPLEYLSLRKDDKYLRGILEIKAYSDVIAKVDNQMLELRKRTEGI